MKNSFKIVYLVGNDYTQIFKKLSIKNCTVLVADDKTFLNNELKQNYKKIFKDNVSFIKYNKLRKKLDAVNGKYLISLSWRRFIIKDIVKKFKYAINIHPAILPQYKGIHPLPYVLKNNEKFHGITAHLIEGEIDAGKILSIKKFRINKFSTIESLQELYNQHLPNFINKLIKKLENRKNLKLKTMNNKKTKIFAIQRTPKDSMIDSSNSLLKVYDDIRSCHQDKYPPYFMLNGNKIYISLSRRLSNSRKKNKFDI